MKVSGKTQSNIEPLPAGMQVANCYALIDLGTQETEWKGEAKLKREVLIMWEVPGERISLEIDGKNEDKPRVISKRYTMSIGEKSNLGKDLVSWRGRAFTASEMESFELKNILGAPCLLNIAHKESNGSTYANIIGVSPLVKGMPPAAKELEPVYFSFEDFTDPSQSFPDGIPEWVQGIIHDSQEFKKLEGASGDSGQSFKDEYDINDPAPGDTIVDDLDDCPF